MKSITSLALQLCLIHQTIWALSPPPFEISLIRIEHELYPISITAFVESSHGYEQHFKAILHHSQLNQSSSLMKSGDELSGWNIKITAINREALDLDYPHKPSRDVVVIEDLVRKQSFTLSRGEECRIKDSIIIEFKTIGQKQESFIFKEIGDSRAIGSATYTLVSYDINKQRVDIKRSEKDSIEYIRALTPIHGNHPRDSR